MMAHWLLLHPDVPILITGMVAAWVTFVHTVYEPDDIRRQATDVALVILVAALLAAGTIFAKSSGSELSIVLGGLFLVLFGYKRFRPLMSGSAKSRRPLEIELAPKRLLSVRRFGDQDVIVNSDRIFVRTLKPGAGLKLGFRIALGMISLGVLAIFQVAGIAFIMFSLALGTVIGDFVNAQRFRCILRVRGQVYSGRQVFCSLSEASIEVTSSGIPHPTDGRPPSLDAVQVRLCRDGQYSSGRVLAVVQNEDIAAEFAALISESLKRSRGAGAWPPPPDYVLSKL